MLRYGDLERTWSMAAISNQSITDDEFSDWTGKMKKANLPTPTAEEALERKKRAEYFKETYVYTPEQVARMVAEKRGRGKQINVTVERTEMEIDLARAKAAVETIRGRLKGKRAAGAEGGGRRGGRGRAKARRRAPVGGGGAPH